ncbi:MULTISPECIES: S41 family peptidase [unclassified Tolypothrix]|uniref:S41 family peptidase n=1 Tax=unclassified Tolypothrix TaxID=2649714 RepID=UPI0005EAC168|nr:MULTISPECIES: S41 family peptidase [unclassified Tolypothrix]BAY89122.1 peptidase S41 [Microchaete diplosiphon NIES-3275]EKE96866.1 peptidase [Tolypothrix sp. PCC 7601]MBE9086388.1 S41 family peptidase [Tolypothrix sp. LEGE 11397]UYD29741.1 S41 family peptidase [Tolypothrix sp. PCC 7712]UYD34343.1 S41 family peptidase [Tolypothrix sp. PCC 7601]
MRLFRLNYFKRLAKVFILSIAILLVLWLSSPLLPIFAKPETQLFEQVWQTVNDNFYDPQFNGVDWPAIKKQYQPQLIKAESSKDVAFLINQMLAQLKSSHTRFYTQDEPAYYQLLGIFLAHSPELKKQLKQFLPTGKVEYTDIGLFTKDINGKIFISSILDDSPAVKAGLKVGDQILSVDGHSYQPIKSFAGKAGQAVKMLIQRSPEASSQQEIAVVPKIYDASTMFLQAQTASVELIEVAGKKVGYIHIWSNAADPYQQQLQDELIYGRLKNADALVLDLRDGWGGGDISYLNIFSAKHNLSLTSIPRSGRSYTYNYQWKKPVVMLVNENSRSSKEIIAFGFQQNKMGLVLGTQTAKAVLGGRPYLMRDGSLLYVAVTNVLVNGNQRLEGKGVVPDINISFPLEYAQGVDPQKQKAIETVLDQVR